MNHEAHLRSILKALTWRATGSLVTFLLISVFTGNHTIAGSVAGIEFVAKIFLYYFHERAWAYVNWGKN